MHGGAGGARAAGNKESLAKKRGDAREVKPREREGEAGYGMKRKMMSRERRSESMLEMASDGCAVQGNERRRTGAKMKIHVGGSTMNSSEVALAVRRCHLDGTVGTVNVK